MAIVHTLMREHMSMVNARQFSPDRTDVTIEMALDAIGADFVELLLTDDQDGVWQIDNDVTIPANVNLHIPLGVTLVGPGNVTILGGIDTLRWPVHLGPGVIIMSSTALHPFFGFLEADSIKARVGEFDYMRVNTYMTVGAPCADAPGPIPDWQPAPNQLYDALIATNQVSEGGGQVINWTGREPISGVS